MNLLIATSPEEFEIPEDHEGAVTRIDPLTGEGVTATCKARDWLPGDVVECLMRVKGEMVGVKFTVGTVRRLPRERP